MSQPPLLLVTGSSGSVGRALVAGLPEAGWRVRGLDLVGPPDDARPEERPGAGLVLGDSFDPALLDEALEGCAAVVHLAAVPNEAPIAQIAASHVTGLAAVLDATVRAGVDRFVLASSNHAVGFTPREPLVGVGTRPRPDSYYGVGKVAGEALCSLYSDQLGLRTAAIRIGSFQPRPLTRRHLSTWLSPGDLVRAVDACLRFPGLTCATIYGISANTRGWWDLAPGRAIGYHPQDDAEAFAAEILAGSPEPAAGDPEHAFLGGAFVAARLPTPEEHR